MIRQVVDLGVLEEYPSNTIPGFVDALVEILPSLEDHACSLGRRGGFITRLREGTWAGHVAEHIALEFQNLAGMSVRHGKTRGTGEYGRYNVIFEYREEQVGIEAGKKAVALVNHLVAPHDEAFAFELVPELESLIRLAERLAFGPSTQALLDEAAGRDIPFIRLDRYSLVQLGQGVHQQRIRATMTSRTGGIAVDIASDKKLTNRLLDSAGLPVPRSEVVDTEDDAVAAARRIGYPCVIKPLDGNHGRGVALDLQGEADVRAAWPETVRQSRGGDVIVESYITGRDYRCLVIGGKLAAVAERVPASVTGDGTQHRARAGRGDERRSPAGHRSREGADPDQARRRRRGRAGRAGLHARLGPRQRARSSSWPSRATCRPAAPRSIARWRRIPTTSRSRRPPRWWWASTSPASTSSAPTSRSPSARPAAASSRSTRRPGSGCTPTPPRASRSTSRSRSSTCCSRRGRRPASRSSP